MFRLLWSASGNTRYYLRRYMPTNVELDAIRTRRGLKWGVSAMLLAILYLFAASICTSLIADGGPGWLNLIVLWGVWNAMKFLIKGPVASCSWFASASTRPSRCVAPAPNGPPPNESAEAGELMVGVPR